MVTSRMPTGNGAARFREQHAQPLGQDIAPTLNADQHDLRAVFVALGDFVGDAREGALNGGGVEDEGGFRHKKSRLPGGCRIADQIKG
jgi:hypothetical protein